MWHLTWFLRMGLRCLRHTACLLFKPRWDGKLFVVQAVHKWSGGVVKPPVVRLSRLGAVDDCQHNSVSVTYQHPHGDIVGAALVDLMATPPESSRPIMTVTAPRCADCGAVLTRRDLKRRVSRGGDLHDPRFKFIWWRNGIEHVFYARRPAEMKLLPTYNQILALMALAVWLIIGSLSPHWGAPFFRYTGCDPNHHVWNLGWPLATCIYDSANSPYFFVGPFAYIYAVAGALSFTGLYVGFVAWNRFGHLLVCLANPLQ